MQVSDYWDNKLCKPFRMLKDMAAFSFVLVQAQAKAKVSEFQKQIVAYRPRTKENAAISFNIRNGLHN